jgi:hypothetical protein
MTQLTPEIITRRKQEKQAWKCFLNERLPTHCLTLTFSAAARFDMAANHLMLFHRKMLRSILGARYYRKTNQPFGIGFTEYASLAERMSELGAPHFHIVYWVPPAHEAAFEALNAQKLWHTINPISNRTAYLDKPTHWPQTITYILKQYPWAPIGHEYIILGQPERFTV